MNIHIDIETRSKVDLIKRGVYNYAEDPSTECICICWAVDDGEVQSWSPLDPTDEFPKDLVILLADDRNTLWAHNATFERLLFERCIEPKYGLLALAPWKCTSVLARAYGLPTSLDDVSRCIGLPVVKDKKGKELIKRMCVPQYEFSMLLLRDMIRYCKIDVEVERAIHEWLPEPDHDIWADYYVNERINDRGILVDTQFAALAAEYATREKSFIKEQFAELTGFPSPASITFTRHLYDFLRYEGNQDLAQLMELEELDKTGSHKISLGRSVVDALLEHPVELVGGNLEALQLKRRYARSSSSKFQSMLNNACVDDRVRGAFMYMGAARTGRYSSKALQVHNMSRDTVDNPEQYIDDVVTGERLIQLEDLPALIRPSLYPTPGKVYVCSDWSGIEARVLPWLADSSKTKPRLATLSDPKADIYVATAAAIHHCEESEVTKSMRQIGKVAELACGFGGGVGAFAAMAKGYGVEIPEEDAEKAVAGWRNDNLWAVTFWNNLEKAARGAVETPDMKRHAGRVTYERRGDVLFCLLPSGRELAYPGVKIEDAPEDEKWKGSQITCIKPTLKPKAGEVNWPREALWKGILAENITQAVAADLLMEALYQVDDSEFPAILHCHDEILLEVPAHDAERALKELEEIMTDNPTWAKGLPLRVESWTNYHYKK